MPIKLTKSGEEHRPKVLHHFAAWGGIKELLRVNSGEATREEVLRVLEYCWHWDSKYQPNTAYLDYAIKSGWLAED
jgi:hypothetical protein